MSYKITISMKNNISGVLHYESSLLDLTLPVEHSGDYSVGFLVFIDELNKNDNLVVKSRVLRDLQQWSKVTDQKLIW
ncbi:hypothetical protein CW740_05500 [Kangiella profundi]|uniref:Uncharacterized protein n=1 Tax=Kangiella profundi TaxID=1561924 RepID=A0A2K9AQN7_9GAMM|nr:hypothetical protein CW740_05500 [Kangiella profundi]